jgi:hypothetical protein
MVYCASARTRGIIAAHRSGWKVFVRDGQSLGSDHPRIPHRISQENLEPHGASAPECPPVRRHSYIPIWPINAPTRRPSRRGTRRIPRRSFAAAILQHPSRCVYGLCGGVAKATTYDTGISPRAPSREAKPIAPTMIAMTYIDSVVSIPHDIDFGRTTENGSRFCVKCGSPLSFCRFCDGLVCAACLPVCHEETVSECHPW